MFDDGEYKNDGLENESGRHGNPFRRGEIPAQKSIFRLQTNGEFDIVTYDEKGYSFYEAKYKSRPVTDGTVQKEIQQVQTTNLNCYQYGFFSKSGFADNVSDTLIKFTLKDMTTGEQVVVSSAELIQKVLV